MNKGLLLVVLLLLLLPGVLGVNLLDGLDSCADFDTGYELTDLTGNYLLTNYGTTSTTGILGDAARLIDANGEMVSFPINYGNDDFTISFLYTPSSAGTYRKPVQFTDGTNTNFHFYCRSSNLWDLYIDTGSASTTEVDACTAGKTYHVVIEKYGDIFTYTINASINNSVTKSFTLDTDADFRVGGGDTQPGKGVIDSFKYWTRALSGAEIAADYNGGSFTSCASILGGNVDISLVSPINYSHVNQGRINFTFNISNTADCDLIVNSVVENSSTGMIAGQYVWEGDLSSGVNKWNVSCNSTFYSVDSFVVLDSIEPLYTETFLNTDNSSIIYKESGVSAINFSGYWYDTYMFAWNASIYNSSGGLMYTTNASNLNGTTEWVNYTVNMVSWGNDNYTVVNYGSDDHTALSIGDYDYRVLPNGLSYTTPSAKIDVENLQGNLKSISTEKVNDRYTFSFEPVNNRKEWSFRLRSSKRLFYRGDLYPFPSFVTGKQWVDFNTGDVDSFVVVMEDEYTARIDIVFRDGSKSQRSFKSIGGLNIGESSYSFELKNNTVPYLSDVIFNDVSSDDNAIASAVYNDYEGDSGTVNFVWLVDGVLSGSDTYAVVDGQNKTSSLLSGFFNEGDVVMLWVWASDSYGVGANYSVNVTVSAGDVVDAGSSSVVAGGGFRFVDAVFLIFFLLMVVIFFMKLFNILSGALWYDLRVGFMLFIGFIISYGVTFFSFLSDASTVLFSVLFLFTKIFIWLVGLFTLVEVLFYLGRRAVKGNVEAYNASER